MMGLGERNQWRHASNTGPGHIRPAPTFSKHIGCINRSKLLVMPSLAQAGSSLRTCVQGRDGQAMPTGTSEAGLALSVEVTLDDEINRQNDVYSVVEDGGWIGDTDSHLF